MKFNFWLEYQKGRDNAVADALSQITTPLGLEAVQAILDGATIGASKEQKKKTLLLSKVTKKEKEVCITTGWVLVEVHVTNWAAAQKEDPRLAVVLQWLESKQKTDLRTLLGEYVLSKEGWMIWRNCQNFTTL